MGGDKNKAISLFKTKDYSKPEHVKTVYVSGKKQSEENMIKSIGNLYKIKKENDVIKDIIIRDIWALSEKQEERDYYKLIIAGDFWNENYMEYESSGDGNKNLLVK